MKAVRQAMGRHLPHEPLDRSHHAEMHYAASRETNGWGGLSCRTPPRAASGKTFTNAFHKNLSPSVQPYCGYTSGVRRAVSPVARDLPYGQDPRHRITPSVRAAGTGNRFRLPTDPKRHFCEWVKTPRCFRRDLMCLSYHPRARQRASDGQPERGVPTPRPFGPALAPVRKTRLLLEARSQTRGLESLACLAPGPTSWADPPSPSQVSCVLCLGVHVASGRYPAAYHRMGESLTRHSHLNPAFSPARRGKLPGILVVSVRCLAPSPPRLTGWPLRALIMVELFTQGFCRPSAERWHAARSACRQVESSPRRTG